MAPWAICYPDRSGGKNANYGQGLGATRSSPNSAEPKWQKVSLRGRPPFLSGQDRRWLDFDFRRGDEKCPQVWLWAQVWKSGGVTGHGLRV